MYRQADPPPTRRPYVRRRHYRPEKQGVYVKRALRKAKAPSDVPRVLDERVAQADRRRVPPDRIPDGFGRARGLIPKEYLPLVHQRGRSSWVNDTIVDDYIKYLYSRRPLTRGRKCPPLILSPYFSQLYVQPLLEAPRNISVLNEGAFSFFYSRRRGGPKYDFLGCSENNPAYLIPVLCDGNHWVFVFLDSEIEERRDGDGEVYQEVLFAFQVFDSLPSERRGEDVGLAVNLVFSYLAEHYSPRVAAPFVPFRPARIWRFMPLDPLPYGRQTNSCDCGIFRLDGICDIFLHNRVPTMRQEDAPRVRKRILRELMGMYRDQRRGVPRPLSLSQIPEDPQEVGPALIRSKNFDRMPARCHPYSRGLLYTESRPHPAPGGPRAPPVSRIMRPGFDLPTGWSFRLFEGLLSLPDAIRLVWDNDDGTRTVLDWRRPRS